MNVVVEEARDGEVRYVGTDIDGRPYGAARVLQARRLRGGLRAGAGRVAAPRAVDQVQEGSVIYRQLDRKPAADRRAAEDGGGDPRRELRAGGGGVLMTTGNAHRRPGPLGRRPRRGAAHARSRRPPARGGDGAPRAVPPHRARLRRRPHRRARRRQVLAHRPAHRAATARTGRTVGVVAVDPTSPFTGGAILGDRIRMQDHALDPGVFIRSLGTRGHLGGLSRSTADVVQVLDAMGKDVILVETVGVGPGRDRGRDARAHGGGGRASPGSATTCRRSRPASSRSPTCSR